MSTALQWMALPAHGLPALFIASLLSATLLPGGSEALLLGLLQLNPALLWPAIVVAGLGNTLGGVVTYGMGRGAGRALAVATAASHNAATPPSTDSRVMAWLRRFGPKACVLAWVPFVGDPLCAVAGWLRLPFWPCVGWMALGKFGRYAVVAAAWHGLVP